MSHQLSDAIALHGAGRVEEAAEVCESILLDQSDNSDALHLLSLITRKAGKLDAALTLVDEAIQHKPRVSRYHNERGVILHRKKRFKDALAAFDHALRLEPDNAQAQFNRGVILQEQWRFEEALGAYDKALRIEPGYAEAHVNRGIVLQMLARLDEALADFDEAVRLKPDYVRAHTNRGVTLHRLGRWDEALTCYEHALRVDPENVLAQANRGASLERLGRLTEALSAYDEALRIRPNLAGAHNNRGNILKSQGLFSEAEAAFREAIRLQPDYPRAESNLLFCLNYDPALDDRDLFEAHRAWGERHRHRRDAYDAYPNPRDPDKTLRVGLVSADFGRHPIGYFVDPLLAASRAEQIEFVCYSGRSRDDDLSEQLKARAHGWRSTLRLDDTVLAETIRADGIDILIDLSGHAAGNRLSCFALKPAPIQVHWAGYCHSVALMDYALWDPIQVPAGEERWFVESVVRLPDCRWCYGPPVYAPPVSDPPVSKRGHVTFGSFNNLAKLNVGVVALWARLLRDIPDCALTLNWPTFADPDQCQRFRALFAEHGIDADRIELRAGANTHQDVLKEFADVDIALDPFPFSGALSTCEALWMGLPVVTLPSTRPVSRQSAALLSALGRSEWVAKDATDYIRIAAALARHPERLAALRRSQRPLMAASALCDAARFARNFEAALRDMWRRWCTRSNRQ